MASKPSWKVYAEKKAAEDAVVKARIARAIPWVAGKEEKFTVWGMKSTWEGEIHFDTHAQAERFCDEAKKLGHTATMRVRIRWSRAYGGSTNGYHRTSREVKFKLDPAKAVYKAPPPPPPPFDPKSVGLVLDPATMTKKDLLEAFEKFSVGKKVLEWMNGGTPGDTSGGGTLKVLEVEPNKITMRCPHDTVSATWDPKRRMWDLRRNYSFGEDSKRDTSTAVWMLLCTAWTTGIRGVIM